jgi:hypothetical protein
MSEQLRALALAATPGPWLKEGHTIYTLVHFGWRKGVEQFKNRFWASVYKDVECPEEERQANVDFIAAANPAAILALLDELEDSHKAYALLFNECVKFRSALEEIKVKLITDDPLDMYDTVCDVLTPVGAAKGESNAD